MAQFRPGEGGRNTFQGASPPYYGLATALLVAQGLKSPESDLGRIWIFSE